MLTTGKHCGHYSIHDVHTKVNTKLLLPDYHRLKYPYRYSMMTKYIDTHKIEKLPSTGNYPEFSPMKETGSEEMVLKSLEIFIEEANIPKNAMIRIDAYRYLHDTHVNTEWYMENYDVKGILCLNQDGLEEGTFQLRKKKEECTMYWKIQPGEMLIIKEGQTTMQRFKTFTVRENGYLDFLMFVY